MDNTSAAREIFLHNMFDFAAIAIFYYDYIITLHDEVLYVWARPKNFSVVCFFANRYLAFFGNSLAIFLNFASLPQNSCKKYGFFRQLLLVVTQVLVCVLLTLRTYALYSRDWRMLCFLLGSGAILISAAAWSLVGQHSFIATNVSGCHVGNSTVTGIHLAVAWEALFTFDVTIFALTIFKTYKTSRRLIVFTQRVPLTILILRDGAFYFFVMALVNLSNILSFYLETPLLKGCLSTFASSVAVSMMSRLMLNLHNAAEAGILSTVTLITIDNGLVFTSHITTMLPSPPEGTDAQDEGSSGSQRHLPLAQWEMQDMSLDLEGQGSSM